MIDRKTIVETITLLKITYPSAIKDLSQEEIGFMINVWCKDFEHTDKESFLKAISNIRYKNKYFPSVAEIKEEIAKTKAKNIPEAQDEWQEVINAVHKFGENMTKVKLYLKPYTYYIANSIGYRNICNSDEQRQIWNRKEFIEEYNALKDKEITNLQIGSNDLKFLDLKEIEYE